MKPLYIAVTSRHHRYFNPSAEDFFQRFTLTFKFKFSLPNPHTVTMLLQKPATCFLLLNTFFLSYSFSSIKLFIISFPLATLDSPFPWRLWHNTFRSNNLFVHENTLYLFLFWKVMHRWSSKTKKQQSPPHGVLQFPWVADLLSYFLFDRWLDFLPIRSAWTVRLPKQGMSYFFWECHRL